MVKRSKAWRKAALSIAMSSGLATSAAILHKVLKTKPGMSKDEINNIIDSITTSDGKGIHVLNGLVVKNGHLHNLLGSGFDMMEGDGFKSTVSKISSKMKKAGKTSREKLEKVGANFIRHVKPHKKAITRGAAVVGAATLAAIAAKHPDLRPVLDKATAQGMKRVSGFADAVKDKVNDPETKAAARHFKESATMVAKKASKRAKRSFQDAFDQPSSTTKAKRKLDDWRDGAKSQARKAAIDKDLFLDKTKKKWKEQFSDILD